MQKLWLTAVFLPVLFFCFHSITNFFLSSFNDNHTPKLNSSFLLVIAHPDDESMFFIPTINAIKAAGGIVHLLCLSTGDNDGLGGIREKELQDVSTFLEFSSLSIINTPHLKDGMSEIWPAALIQDLVSEAMEAKQIDFILTFDGYGVSGHTNHIAIHTALNGKFKGFALKSLPLAIKYTFSIGSVFLRVQSLLLKRNLFLYHSNGFDDARKAMRFHRSQMVWFRHLFLYFSTFTTVNMLEPL